MKSLPPALLALLFVGLLVLPVSSEEPAPAPDTPAVEAQTQDQESPKPACQQDQAAKDEKDPFAWRALTDGKTLEGWKVPNFGAQGEVTVKDGAIVLEMGEPMTGITYTGEVPKNNYILELEAKRTDGNDFFATTTFPVGKEPCSFVVGGWGGTVVGLSCVDFYDASDNFTTNFMDFEDDKWYKIRVRVSDPKVECFVDDEKVVDQVREGHGFSIRFEVDLCQPLGICTWISSSEVRNVRLRRLRPEEVQAIVKEVTP